MGGPQGTDARQETLHNARGGTPGPIYAHSKSTPCSGCTWQSRLTDSSSRLYGSIVSIELTWASTSRTVAGFRADHGWRTDRSLRTLSWSSNLGSRRDSTHARLNCLSLSTAVRNEHRQTTHGTEHDLPRHKTMHSRRTSKKPGPGHSK